VGLYIELDSGSIHTQVEVRLSFVFYFLPPLIKGKVKIKNAKGKVTV
jgi:hypothetical protein